MCVIRIPPEMVVTINESIRGAKLWLGDCREEYKFWLLFWTFVSIFIILSVKNTP
jgi:hypothetical protein